MISIVDKETKHLLLYELISLIWWKKNHKLFLYDLDFYTKQLNSCYNMHLYHLYGEKKHTQYTP
ncbi:hypothetical protein D3C85_1700130 [compost metagenome]